MIAAGVNAKALSAYMGHANISITLDRYGHLMPGNEEQAADLLDGYLQRSAEAAARAGEAGTCQPPPDLDRGVSGGVGVTREAPLSGASPLLKPLVLRRY